jgi:hypothetical protein
VSEQLLIAYVAGAFGLGGALVGSLLTILNSTLEHRRREKSESTKASNEEYALLHGAFALTNFINARINEFEETRNVYSLARLNVAQSYMNALVGKTPSDNNRLMVTLVGLGLRLDAVLFVLGAIIGVGNDSEEFPLTELEASLDELCAELEQLELILSLELPISSIEELVEMGIVQELPSEIEKEKSE